MKKYLVYAHKRKTDDKIFYIGKGTIHRARSSACRNKHWHNIVKKHGFSVLILSSFSLQEDAYMEEIKIIDGIGLDNLCNITRGGEGGTGAKSGPENPMFGRRGTLHPRFGKSHTEEQRGNIRRGRKQSGKCKMSPGNVEKLKDRMTGNTYNLGKKMSSESRMKISIAMTGCGNPSFNPEIINFVHDGGEKFSGTRSDFFNSHNVSRGNLSSIISGRLKKTKGWSVCR